MERKSIVFMTGAGISKESGIATFRDSVDGLWNNYKIEEVSSIDGWNRDANKVLNFFNERRREMQSAEPNDAHKIIGQLEEFYDVTVITQNIDDLHERGGSTNVIHLHGEILRVREVAGEEKSFRWEKDLTKDDRSPSGLPMRPDVVWFGENVKRYDDAMAAVKKSHAYIVVGTSLEVFPASQLHLYMPKGTTGVIIDPNMVYSIQDFLHLEMKATDGMQFVQEILTKENVLQA
jgi:NAD-dependent deacetylase